LRERSGDGAAAIRHRRHPGEIAGDRGRETEVEAMTSYVVRKAKELGVPVPVTESIVYRMGKGAEYAAKAKRARA
jgi:hypothetical protein